MEKGKTGTRSAFPGVNAWATEKAPIRYRFIVLRVDFFVHLNHPSFSRSFVMLKLRTVAGLVLLTALVVFVGCSQEQPKSAPSGDQKAADQKSADAATAEKTTADLPGLKDLSPEDLAAVKKQKVCPVSGELLGEMAKPYKVTIKGQTIFLCCSGCEDDLKKDPDKYLAKLKK
jgi:YHS domain-containing protein